MRHGTISLFLLLLMGSTLQAAVTSTLGVDVLVAGREQPEYRTGTRVYVEALRGHEYELRLTNPTPHRIAVALSVDGLNTIDARRSSSWSAAKWVLGPYESAVISGWQVDREFARRFFFTTEEQSYAAALGHTENLGVIEAIAYRERQPRVSVYSQPERERKQKAGRSGAESSAGADAKREPASSPATEPMIAPDSRSDEYAATGMGDRTWHEVERVQLLLDPEPIATVRIRYEYRPQLVELGLVPDLPSRLRRREGARGFCPEP